MNAIILSIALAAAPPSAPPSPSPFPSTDEELDDKLARTHRIEFTGNAMAVTTGIVGGVALVAGFGAVTLGDAGRPTALASVCIASVGLIGVVVGLAVAGAARGQKRRVLHQMALRRGGLVFRF